MVGTGILRIATRRSALALWQAEHVAARLQAAHAGLAVELLPLSTRGDEVLDRSLAELGGKGLFLKELEQAMVDGKANLAVHSLKDVPAELEHGFALPAILARADPADAFVSVKYAQLADLPHGARVGTSSLRRTAQLRALRPDLEIAALRGNVNTRLAKLERGDYDAIVLAVAGLDRLGLRAHIRSRLAPPDWLSAPGQAAIAIECRADDAHVAALASALDDADTRVAVTAERALSLALGGNCTVPVAAFAGVDGERLHLRALVGDVATGALLHAHAEGARAEAAELGQRAARALLDQGAAALLRALVER